MAKFALTVAMLLALVACREKPDAPVNRTEVTVVPADETVALPDANDMANMANESAPADVPDTNSMSPAPPPAETMVIPAALRGRWGMVAADCTSTRGDAKGLLTISDSDLRFYESRGSLKAITEQSPTRLDAEFAFSGEGMTWNRRMTLDVQDNGTTLVRREYGEDAMAGPQRYRKCG